MMQFEAAKTFIIDKLKKELPDHLFYHSVNHIMDVYNASEILAKEEKINDYDIILLLTAALFHDSGFLVQQKDHEKISCEIARAHLPSFGYNDEDIEKICGMISATKVPQNPQNHLGQIICDADLDYLGRDDFFAIGNKLFTELSLYGIIRNENEWNNLQIRFLESHTYFTDSAKRLRKDKKQEHLELIKSKIV